MQSHTPAATDDNYRQCCLNSKRAYRNQPFKWYQQPKTRKPDSWITALDELPTKTHTLSLTACSAGQPATAVETRGLGGGWASNDQDTRTSLWCLFVLALKCWIICWLAFFASNNPGLSVWQDYVVERNASPASITCGPLFWEVKIKPANLGAARYGPDSTDYDPLGAIVCEILSPVETTTSVRSFLLHQLTMLIIAKCIC